LKLININLNKSDKIIFISIFCISFLLFLFYVNSNAYDNFWDESAYILDSQQISDGGFFEFESNTHTYIYPAIIASLKIFSNDDIVIQKIILSVIQYAVYLVTVIFIANYAYSFSKSKPKSPFPNFIDPKKGAQHYIDRYNNESKYKSWFDKYYPNYTIEQATQLQIPVRKMENKIIWHSIIALGFLNPVLIQATTLFLTDILTSCFLVVSIFSLTRLDLTKSKFAFFSIGLFYASIMIRSTAAILFPVFVGIILFRFLKNKNISIYKVSIISIILLVIFIPQIYQNVTNFDEWTPLIVRSHYEEHIFLGTEYIKSGSTVVIPGEAPSLFYKSPFQLPEQNLNMYQLFWKDPSTFFLLSLSHIFGALDWDYVDTYIKEYYPPHRIPASLLIYSTWFFVIWGIFSARKNFFSDDRLLLITSIISAILSLAFIATIIETQRYGYPIFFLLLPFFGYGIKHFYESCIKHDNKTSNLWLRRIGFITIYSLFISTFFYISFWFSYQSGRVDWFGFYNLFN